MVLLEASILTINGTLVAQLLIFLATALVLYRLAWGPVLQAVAARQNQIRDGIEAAERAQRDREAAEREYQQKLDEARRQGQAIIEQVTRQSEALRQELEQKARAQADQILVQARAEIERERLRAAHDLRSQVADMAVQAAGRILGETLDPQKHRQLIERSIEEAELRV